MPVYPVSSPDATATDPAAAAADPAGMLALSASGCAGAAVVAVRLADLVCPVRQGASGQIRSGLVVGGTQKIRTGDTVVWLTVIAITPAKVMRDGQVRADGKACDHVRLGVLEEQLNATTGCPDAIGQVAATIPPDTTTAAGKETSTGKKKKSPVGRKARSTRVMNDALAMRGSILMTLMPDADYRQIMTCLFGGLVHVPWKNAPLVIPSPSVLTNWRKRIPAWVLVRLQDMMFAGTDGELRAHDPTVIDVGGGLRLCSLDGSVTRMADTTDNRDAYGSTGTTSDNAAYPQLRQLHASEASARATLASNHGPAGTDKAESEQALLDRMVIEYTFIFTKDRLWVMDRNFPGVPRIKRMLKTGTHVLIRLKSDIKLTKIGATLPDGSYLAIVSGGGETIIMRVIEYHAAPRGARLYPLLSRERLEGCLWVRCLTRSRKRGRNNSMVANRRLCPGVRGDASGDPL